MSIEIEVSLLQEAYGEMNERTSDGEEGKIAPDLRFSYHARKVSSVIKISHPLSKIIGTSELII